VTRVRLASTKFLTSGTHHHTCPTSPARRLPPHTCEQCAGSPTHWCSNRRPSCAGDSNSCALHSSRRRPLQPAAGCTSIGLPVALLLLLLLLPPPQQHVQAAPVLCCCRCQAAAGHWRCAPTMACRGYSRSWLTASHSSCCPQPSQCCGVTYECGLLCVCLCVFVCVEEGAECGLDAPHASVCMRACASSMPVYITHHALQVPPLCPNIPLPPGTSTTRRAAGQ
jgi:hypothetical protein